MYLFYLMKSFLFVMLFFSFSHAQEECDNVRYVEEIFDNVNVTSNVLFGGNYNPNIWGQNEFQDLYLDIYEPAGDDLEDRPLVFFLYGGSFVAGSKTNGDVVELCTRYAKMGYVAAAIDYRLTTDLIWFSNEETAYKATTKAMHDLKGAIRWFRKNDANENEYRIDSDRIYAGGISAGGITVVNAAYLNEESEIPDIIVDYVADNGGLEGLSGNEGYDSHFHGIINLCGAVGDDDWIVEGDIPIVSIHGDEDSIVPYGDGLITLFGLNMQVYGSFVINETMHALGNESDLYTFYGYDHNPFNESGADMDVTVEFTSDFLLDVVCPADENMMGDLNGDSILNVQDIIVMVNIILGYDDDSEFADINGDGITNVIDVIQLVNAILGS